MMYRPECYQELIPDEVLEKPGKLTDEEFNIMKEHAYYTWVLLKDIAGFEQIVVIKILREDAQNGFLSDKLVALLTDHYDAIDSIRNNESRAASKAYQEGLKAGN